MRRKSLMAMGFILLLGFLILSLSGVAFADNGISRSILKTGSLLAAIFSIIGIALAGYFAGKSYDSHTGWERHHHGAGQFYNRKTSTNVYHSEPYVAPDVVYFDGFGGARVYAIPSLGMVIVRTGSIATSWDDAMLPNVLVRGLQLKKEM